MSYLNKIFNKKNTKAYHCFFCSKKSIFNNYGDPARLNVQCPNCGSLERHRFLFLIYKMLFLGNKAKIKILHMSPEKCLSDLLKSYDNIDYTAADIEPKNYRFISCLKEDYTNMSFPNNYFDVILSSQVAEHIKDEQAYLVEMRRCLKDDGFIVLNIPFKIGLVKTFEDDSIITDEERKRNYGQHDHVRLYGEDASLRFEKASFIVNKIEEDIFNNDFLEINRLKYINDLGINPGGYFILRKKLSIN